MMISFTIYGEPVAQARPRFNRYTGCAYDPKKSKDFKKLVAISALPYKPKELLTGALKLNIKVFRSMPKMSKTKALLALEGHIRPTTKPDIDNYVKGVKDALNGVIYKDDSQVVCLHAEKYYSDSPRIEIVLREM